MAQVNLLDLFIHRLDDLTDFVQVDVFGAMSAPEQTRGEVRTYAGGVRRIVKRKGRHKPVNVSFPATRDVIEKLEEWVGEPVMLRDPPGRLVFGVFFEVGQEEIDGGDWVNVSLSVEEITHSVAV
jgi:hypothetical protein